MKVLLCAILLLACSCQQDLSPPVQLHAPPTSEAPALSDLCPQTGCLLLALAGNYECARHDPDNPVYQQEITKAMALLEKHFSECDRCREAFDNWEPGK